ncbi:sugar MFS transporter [Planctomycetota bacterium]
MASKENSKLALVAVLLTLTAFAVSGNTIPPLATTIAETIGTDYVNFGYIFMLQFLCFAIACWFGGKAAEYFGLSDRSLVFIGIFGTGAMVAIGGLLPGIWWFALWVIPLGAAGGLVDGFGSIMVTKFGRSDSSKMLNICQVFFCAGAVSAPYMVSVLLKLSVSWNVIFLLFGGFIILVGLFFTYFTRGKLSASGHDVESAKSELKISLHKDKVFLMLAGCLFVYVVVECSIVAWVTAYFEKHLELTRDSAAWRLGMYWLGVGLGRGLMLLVPSKLTLWPAAITGIAGMVVGNFVLSFQLSSAWATFAVFLAGVAAGPVWPVIVCIAQHFRKSSRFTASVIGAGALGAAVGPWVSSYIIKYLGWEFFFPVLTGSSIFLFVIMLLANRKTKHESVES